MALCRINPNLPVLRDKDICVVRHLIKNASWIVAAVDNLRVVEKILKDEEFEEYQKSNDSVNNIISCLQTLDNFRLQLHEELEIQSIRGFIMKQTYLTLPLQIKDMIEAAVVCAKNEAERIYRKSEKEENFLKTDLEKMRKELSVLEEENKELPQKQKEVIEVESKIVEEFNMKFKQKLELKEKLRKLREKIRAENQKIVHTEAEILKMKDDILLSRTQAKKEIEFYSNQIEEMKKHKDIWQEKVKTVEPEYTEIMGKLKTSEKKIEGIKTTMKCEGRKMSCTARLKGTYKIKIEQEKKMRNNLFDIKNKNVRHLANLKVEVENNLAEITRTHNEMEMKILFENARDTELEEAEKEVTKVLIFFREIEENARRVWKASKERLDFLQSQLAQHEAELFRYMNERSDRQDTVGHLDEVFLVKLEQMKMHIDTLIDTLNLKKKARIEIEELEENTLRRLEEVRVDRDNFEAATKKLIKDMELEYAEKLNLVKSLQVEIKQTVDEIKRKVGDVRLMQDIHEDECLKKEALIKANEEEAEEKERILNEISTKFENLSNPFQELAFQYQECLQKYSSIYRRHSERKYKFNELSRSKSNAEINLRILYKEKEKLEKAVEKLNARYKMALRRHLQDAQEIEGEIYKQLCRLKFLRLENHIFKEGIENYKLNIEEAVQYNDNERELQTSLKELIRQLRAEFYEKQKKIDDVGELALQRDTPFINQYSEVLDVINFNIELTKAALVRINQEIVMLNSKWGNLEKMRPF